MLEETGEQCEGGKSDDITFIVAEFTNSINDQQEEDNFKRWYLTFLIFQILLL